MDKLPIIIRMDKLAINIASGYMSNSGNEYSEYSHEDIMAALKFIGKVKINEKISTSSMTVQDKDSFYTSIIRTFTTQNRIKTIVFLQNVIDRAFEIACMYTRDQDQQKNITGWFIIDDINKSRSGLYNILNTYKEDRMFVCKMESLLQKIEVKLKSFENPVEITKSEPVPILNGKTANNSPLILSETRNHIIGTPIKISPVNLSQYDIPLAAGEKDLKDNNDGGDIE